jgi:uncharacterized membrane protein YhaH (DUF805 family)
MFVCAYVFNIEILDNPIYNLPFIILTTYPLVAVYVKRLHDRGKSWWWFAPFYPLYLADMFFHEIFEYPSMIYSLWLLLECGLFRGNTGPNRFGADPRTAFTKLATGAAD